VLRNTNLFKVRDEAVKPFTTVWISHMLIEVFLLMHPALVPVFIKEFNLSIFDAGLIITVPSLCRLIFTLPAGIFTDRFGQRRLVILSVLVGGLGALLVSQSPTASFLVFSLSLIMISVTLYHPPGLSILQGWFSDPKERSTAIGLHGASGCIGQSIGTISLGLLLIQFGWRFCYLLFAVPLLAWAAILVRTRTQRLPRKPPETKQVPTSAEVGEVHHGARKSSLITLGFIVLMASMGLNALANGSVGAFMTTYLTRQRQLAVDVASIIFGAGPLVGIVGSLVGGYLCAEFGEKNSLVLVYVGQAIFLLGLITIPLTSLAIVSFFTYQLFSNAMWTPASSMVASLADTSSGGKAYSLYFLSSDGPGAVSPLIAAVLITNFNIIFPFGFAVILLASNVLLVRLISAR
jgi:FSR family fosmidomycin resistance protein-like MFS transporter